MEHLATFAAGAISAYAGVVLGYVLCRMMLMPGDDYRDDDCDPPNVPRDDRYFRLDEPHLKPQRN